MRHSLISQFVGSALVSLSLAISLTVVTAGCGQSGVPLVNPSSMVPDGGAPSPDLVVVPLPPDLGDNGAPSKMYPASFPAPPQVINSGGPVLANPRIIPVYFSNDDPKFTAQTIDFLNRVGATDYWKATTSEYGVGPATASAPVQLAEAAPQNIDDSGIQKWLVAKLDADDPAFPAGDKNSLYVIHYPMGTAITYGGSKSCTAFGAYHGDVRLDKAHGYLYVAYAVIPRCQGNGMNLLDTDTASESHELVEAATDPYPSVTPAYSTLDTDHSYWTRLNGGGGETGDMCESRRGAYTKFPELPYMVQRTWSNAAILAGHDPCVPAPAGVNFGAVPDFKDSVSIQFANSQWDVLAVNVPVGTSQTIDLALFSDGDTGGPFTVSVATLGRNGNTNLTFALDRDAGQNGERLHLTITTNTASRNGWDLILITSTDKNGSSHTWLGAVGEM